MDTAANDLYGSMTKTMSYQIIEKPSLTTAIRQFANISQQYTCSQRKCLFIECQPSWQELHVLLRKQCKDRNAVEFLNSKIRQLLQVASDIIGEEESIETKQNVVAVLFVKLYNVEQVTTSTTKELSSEIGILDFSSVKKAHEILCSLCSTLNNSVVEAMDNIIAMQESSSMFGQKIKFNSQLPLLDVNLGPDSDDESVSSMDIVDKLIQLNNDQVCPAEVEPIQKQTFQQTESGLPWLERQLKISVVTCSASDHDMEKISTSCATIDEDCLDDQPHLLNFSSGELTEAIVSLLASEQSSDHLQNEFCELLGFEHLDFIADILNRRGRILQDLKRSNATNGSASNYRKPHFPKNPNPSFACQVTVQTESEKLVAKMIRKEEKKHKRALAASAKHNNVNSSNEFDTEYLRKQRNKALSLAASAPLFSQKRSARSDVEMYPNVYDAKSVAIQSAAFVGGVKMALPEGFELKSDKRFEEIRIPATVKYSGQPWEPIKIAQLDEIARLAFRGIKQLNTIQSRVFETAYCTNENLLICAPTGAGKTNVAMLTIVREIMRNVESGVIQTNKFKIVYVAPMKALAAEMTTNFGNRLSSLGISVKELTGDMQLTKTEITNTQMLITTPEKWDVVTRKSTGDVALARLVRLLIIDEVHLLHDERGPVLETLVARTLRQVETQQTMIRIVGLSATLPNYIDVARFLRVNPHKGLFFFDGRFRPVPLQQTFIGVKTRSLMQQRLDMDEACYDVVTKNLFHDYQVLVFVHARNATVRTAKALLELARNNNELSFFSCKQHEQFGLANKQVQRSRNREVRELFQDGMGVHHAGMLRSDRSMVEQMFSKGLIRVLCCTATLAWGVNLPAHAVVIKGTQVYNAKMGSFVDLGILDVMQIFGRAGRPQFDTTGEGTIITTHDKLSKYLALLTRQNPIESQFIDCLVDNLNAEISLGTVNTVEDGVKWLSYTYLFTRMRKNPLVYGISAAVLENDPGLVKWQRELIVFAGRKLDKAHMVRFEERTGYFSPTDMGRTSSHYYIKYHSIETFNELLRQDMDITAILGMISKSHEFEQIKVRDDEMTELDELIDENCILKVKGGPEDPEGKANILLQTYISCGDVHSFSLTSDLMYIAQNAGRIVRGVFEIVLKKGMTRVSSRLLKLCKSVDRRLWPHNTPLRQFGARLGKDVLRKIEENKMTIDKMRDMKPNEIGAMLRHPSVGSKVMMCINEMPYVHLETSIQPITRTILRIKLVITPDFRWNFRVHGSTSEPFWVWVEDPESDHMYHCEYVNITKKQVMRKEPQNLLFTIPLIEPHPSQYMVHLESDRWFGSSAVCPISFKHLILPDRHPPHTELLDLEPLPITALEDKYQAVYKFSHFNPIQTQIFHCLYHSDTNALIGAPTGSGKTVAAELAVFRMLRTQPGCKAVYVAPLKALVRERMNDWKKRLSLNLGLKLVELTGDIAPDMRAVAKADVIITTPEKWDGVSRSWHTRGYVRQVSLLIIDEIHLLGQDRGPVLEVIVSRTNFISSQTEKAVRIVGLSTALANAKDLADWLGIKEMGLFNFRPSVRPVPMEVHINGFAGKHYCPRMASMNKPCFQAIRTHSPAKPVLIFVSSRRQTRLTALDLIAHLALENDPKQWLHMDEMEMEELTHAVKDPNLRLVLAFGIGIHHAGLVERDRCLVEQLFAEQKIQTLIATSTLAWGVNLPAHLVIVKGTEYFDGKQSRYVDFPITDVLQMMGRAGRPQYDDKAVSVILVHDVKKAFYKKFLYEPFPVESSLLEVLEDHLNAEIVAGTVANRQEAMDYLTWTYFFRRLLMNPTYYELEDTEHDSVNLFLSKLLEKSVRELQLSGCVATDTDNELQALNAGRISSFYYLSHLSMRMLHEEMKSESSIEDILLLLSNAQEYHELPVRHNEDAVNSDLSRDLPVTVDATTFDSAHTKALLLLYAHLCRIPLPSTDYVTDLKSVLDQAIRVLQAFVDASADCGWLVTSLRCMHTIQMVSQASWFDDSTLMTLPNVERNNVFVFDNLSHKRQRVECLPELMQLYSTRPNVVRDVLSKEFSSNQVDKICNHISNLPVVEITVSVRGWWSDSPSKEVERNIPIAFGRSLREPDTWLKVHADQEYNLTVKLRRLNRDYKKSDDKSLTPRFPKPKLEGWFLVLGDREKRELLALKRISTLRRRTTETMSFFTPNSVGRLLLTLWLISDSYIGLDQLYDVRLDVTPSDIASQFNQEVILSEGVSSSCS